MLEVKNKIFIQNNNMAEIDIKMNFKQPETCLS